jgi:tRNA threonylcarbamoyladenosine biosynthesis protein TsaE
METWSVSSVERTFESGSPDETRALGAALGERLGPGDVVLLYGELGAGKTAFVQGLARGLGVPPERRVASPTFTLVNEHTGRCPLYHIDLYRLDDPDEIEEMGMREYLASAGVTVIEWAERLSRLQPAHRLEVAIAARPEAGPDARQLTARAVGARAETVLGAWSR